MYDYELKDVTPSENTFLSIAFPLAGFALGMVFVKKAFRALGGHSPYTFVVFWSVLMVCAEWLGRKGNVRNTTQEYNTLGICGCLSAPPFMKIFYFSVGGVFYVLDDG